MGNTEDSFEPRGEHEEEKHDQPIQQEVGEAIEQLSNNKKAGSDNILAELIKNGSEALCHARHKVIGAIWEKKVHSNEWNMDFLYNKQEGR